jgi:hypothetical protein
MKDLITPSWLSGLVTTGKPPEENEAQKDDSNFMVHIVYTSRSKRVFNKPYRIPMDNPAGLTLEGDSGEEVAL